MFYGFVENINLPKNKSKLNYIMNEYECKGKIETHTGNTRNILQVIHHLWKSKVHVKNS